MSDKGERTARTGKYCARCHSTEGFQEITTMGTFWVTNEMLNGTKITCAACHKHSAFDFGNDPVSKIFRTTAPVYLNYENYNLTTNVYDKKISKDYGDENNLCANCHQIRGTTVATYTDPNNPIKPVTTGVKFTQQAYFPIANAPGISESTPVKYRAATNFSIHEGANQPDYLISRGGYEYTGKTYTRTTAHSAFECTDCHFNALDATATTGGHTMKVNLKDASCTACHDLTTKIPQTLATINAKLVELGDLLAARKVFKKTASTSASALNGFTYSAQPSHDFYGTLLPTTDAAPATFALTLTSKNAPSPTTGLLVYNSEVGWAADTDFANRIGREWKYGELGAAFNFTYVNSVATPANRGIHNPTYAMELLQTSIDYLKSNQ
jgi:nitrate/TMAO reductase-like tetraheme cytochrome c subunit